MAEMGSYCKAYLAKQFREYPNWKENTSDLRKDTQEVDGKEVEVARDAIDGEDILYLQETYVVTDGIFLDENVVFDDVTDEWKQFCHEKLEFEIPEDVKAAAEAAQAAVAEATAGNGDAAAEPASA
ncbi:MAG TPA: hypothetical protein VHQ65_09050 [Thermoanaerobaculia bacterium]|nr:hypothetical protein [Thermoanaerobaculia bacterium]